MARQRLHRARRFTLILAALMPLAAGVAVLDAAGRRERLASISTLELCALLGLFVLPAATFWAMRLESRWRRRLAASLVRERAC